MKRIPEWFGCDNWLEVTVFSLFIVVLGFLAAIA